MTPRKWDKPSYGPEHGRGKKRDARGSDRRPARAEAEELDMGRRDKLAERIMRTIDAKFPQRGTDKSTEV